MPKQILKIVFFLAAFFLVPTFARAATYYVDPSGNDSLNSGLSTSAPWKTVAKINSQALQPGDSVLFLANQTWREQLIIPAGGTLGNPISFGAYGLGAKPIISGGSFIAGAWTQFSGNTYSIATSLWIDRSSHARVFAGVAQLTQAASPALASGQYYFQFSGNPGTSGALLAGTLYVSIGKAPNSTDIEAVIRKRAAYVNKSYINFDGLNFSKAAYAVSQYTGLSVGVEIRNCLLDYSTMGIYTGASALINSRYWIVENNVFQNNGQNNIYDQALYEKFGSGWIIQNNVFKNNGAYALDINGSSNNIIRNNHSEGNGAGFLEFYEDTAGGSQNNQIYNNVSNNERLFIYSGGGADHTGNIVSNNTIFDFSGVGISIDAGSLAVFKNNILWSTQSKAKYYSVVSSASILSSSNNIIGPFTAGAAINYRGNSYSSLASFKNAFPSLETNSISLDPKFLDSLNHDLHLQVMSPALDKAVTVMEFSQDIDGILRPEGAAWDIGAYEYHTSCIDNVAPEAPSGLSVE